MTRALLRTLTTAGLLLAAWFALALSATAETSEDAPTTAPAADQAPVANPQVEVEFPASTEDLAAVSDEPGPVPEPPHVTVIDSAIADEPDSPMSVFTAPADTTQAALTPNCHDAPDVGAPRPAVFPGSPFATPMFGGSPLTATTFSPAAMTSTLAAETFSAPMFSAPMFSGQATFALPNITLPDLTPLNAALPDFSWTNDLPQSADLPLSMPLDAMASHLDPPDSVAVLANDQRASATPPPSVAGESSYFTSPPTSTRAKKWGARSAAPHVPAADPSGDQPSREKRPAAPTSPPAPSALTAAGAHDGGGTARGSHGLLEARAHLRTPTVTGVIGSHPVAMSGRSAGLPASSPD
ncbi:MAG: hypothetical protein M3548_03655 [Actinomycetota bacterium]|nr:hypothetical protein [Actinomycetota bacterium]